MNSDTGAMKITQIMLGKGFGGAERSFVDTALALAARGHEVQAICHRDFIKRNLLEGVTNIQLDPVKAGGELDFVTPRRIAGHLRAFGPEIVHTQLKRAAWHGGRAARKVGIPVVSKLHNYVQLERYKHVHTLIGTTEDQRRHALEQGWPKDRIVVIPNFSRVVTVESARLPKQSQVRLLTYGRYVHKKGFDVLLRAVARLVGEGMDLSLIVGGKGEELQSLSALSEELGIADRVELGVWIDDVSVALDEADIFVLPSRDEPFGIVMLEAMARGLPIVTTRTQGPSQVLNEDSAYFAEIDSVDDLVAAIKDAVTYPDSAEGKASAALDLYKTTYYEDAVLPRLEELYRSVSSR